MKKTVTFLGIFIILTLFVACADKNAFDKFNMQEDQELAAANLQSSKIKTSQNIDGIVSVIYLNKVYPKIYTNDEYFYVYLYLKDKKEMFDPKKLDDIKLTMRLNSKLPIKIKKLDAKNKFSHLTSVENEWNLYYLVAFKQESEDKISLVLETDQSRSDVLVYQKDE
ncbi:hypothetical protein M947_00475 [Sulfurimonas hongkongensis]|uniref:Lipoprotein n=1 Tax=Sulfurimonas hongkongensis TaxID=1172190 RepID=T0KTI2_9BACT|nr:hypothetical protein [Sulfurimonas hongkongensis]EQB40304.1 hypothetical protein M947_00475 [Sulfurimonas hongkongensis]